MNATRPQHPGWRHIGIIALTTMCAGLTLLLTPAAHADTSDQRFADLAATQGITSDKGASALAGLGRQVCSVLDSGYSESQAAKQLEGVMTIGQASYFVGVSEGYYCPQHLN